MDLTISTVDHALFPLLHFVLDDLPTSTKNPELDNRNARAILTKAKISSCDMRSLMPLYLGYLCAVGFLEGPADMQLPSLESWKTSKGNLVKRTGL